VPAGKPAAPAPAPVAQEQKEKTSPAKPSTQKKIRPAKTEVPPTSEREVDGEEGPRRSPKGKRVKKKTPKVSMAGQIFGVVGTILVVAVLGLVLSGRWVPLIWKPLQEFLESQGIPPIVAIIATGLVLLIPLSLWQGMSTKAAALRNIAVELDFLPAKVEKFPQLDTKLLAGWTEDFNSLGFTHLMDYRVETELENHAKGFARLFVHPEEHVFAEINQGFSSGGQAAPMGCNLSSFLEDGWSFSTGNRKPSSTLYLLRRLKGMWLSRPGEEPQELLRIHLKRRKTIATNLGRDVLTDASAESYFAHERQAALDRKKAVEGRNFIRVTIDLWFFEKNPKYEWLGDSARAAAKKKKS
jgi:hypothetical protein